MHFFFFFFFFLLEGLYFLSLSLSHISPASLGVLTNVFYKDFIKVDIANNGAHPVFPVGFSLLFYFIYFPCVELEMIEAELRLQKKQKIKKIKKKEKKEEEDKTVFTRASFMHLIGRQL